jgi:hypothetical protein
MRLRSSIPGLLVLVPVLTLLAGCGDDTIDQSTSAPPTSDPSGSVSSPPLTTNTGSLPTGGQAAPIRSRTDLVDARAFEPESVTVDPTNDKRLVIRFWGGVEPCFGVEVRVVESPTDVKVTVLGGAPPDARDKSCIALAKYYEASADLASALGSRAIVVMK